MPLSIGLKGPLLLVVVGVVLAFVFGPENQAAAGCFAAAFLWALATGRARKTYWNARIRTRAAHDERRALARASKLQP